MLACNVHASWTEEVAKENKSILNLRTCSNEDSFIKLSGDKIYLKTPMTDLIYNNTLT